MIENMKIQLSTCLEQHVKFGMFDIFEVHEITTVKFLANYIPLVLEEFLSFTNSRLICYKFK